MAQLLALLTHVVFPVATIAVLVRVRRRYPLRAYFICSIVLLALAVMLWLRVPQIEFWHRGPLDAGGFDTWAVPVAAISLAAICSFALHRWYLRALQYFVAFAIANFWILFA